MIAKLLVLIVVVAIVWYGFRVVSRGNRPRTGPAPRKPAERSLEDAQDTTRCAVCGTFVPDGAARDCGRDGCPYPG